MIKINLIHPKKEESTFFKDYGPLSYVAIFSTVLILIFIFIPPSNDNVKKPRIKTIEEIQTQAITDLTEQIKELNQRLDNMEQSNSR